MPHTPPVVRPMCWLAGLVLAVPAVLLLSGAATSPASSRAHAAAYAPVPLGTADGFAVLAGSTITHTGPTVINGDLGLHPGSAVVGLPSGAVSGARDVADAVAQQAATDLTTAYNDAAARPSSATSPPNLGGRSLTGGVYRPGALAPLRSPGA